MPQSTAVSRPNAAVSPSAVALPPTRPIDLSAVVEAALRGR